MSTAIKHIPNPEFIVLVHKNVVMLEQTRRNLCKDGWYPVGGVGEKKPEWTQVMVRQGAVPDSSIVGNKTAPASLDDEEDIYTESDGTPVKE